jgi:hypothetical protein
MHQLISLGHPCSAHGLLWWGMNLDCLYTLAMLCIYFRHCYCNRRTFSLLLKLKHCQVIGQYEKEIQEMCPCLDYRCIYPLLEVYNPSA